jgi:hypothetical protein
MCQSTETRLFFERNRCGGYDGSVSGNLKFWPARELACEKLGEGTSAGSLTEGEVDDDDEKTA